MWALLLLLPPLRDEGLGAVRACGQKQKLLARWKILPSWVSLRVQQREQSPVGGPAVHLSGRPEHRAKGVAITHMIRVESELASGEAPEFCCPGDMGSNPAPDFGALDRRPDGMNTYLLRL